MMLFGGGGHPAMPARGVPPKRFLAFVPPNDANQTRLFIQGRHLIPGTKQNWLQLLLLLLLFSR